MPRGSELGEEEALELAPSGPVSALNSLLHFHNPTGEESSEMLSLRGSAKAPEWAL